MTYISIKSETKKVLILGSVHEILIAQSVFSMLKKGNISMGLKKADYIWFNGKILPWEKATVHVWRMLCIMALQF